MQPFTDALNQLFSGISGSWTAYLLAMTGLGTLTMAIIQVVKDTTPLRRLFFRQAMRDWLFAHAQLAQENLREPVCADCAEKELLVLATDADRKAFYALDIERLCGQWSAAAQVVSEYPTLYKNLFKCMAARAAKTDQDLLLAPEQNLPDVLPPSLEVQLRPEVQTERTKKRQLFTEARTRVAHQIQRAIDSFQIKTSYRWEWRLRIASFAVSASIAFCAYGFKTPSLGALLGAAVAGFLAPVARDLLAAVQKLRD